MPPALFSRRKGAVSASVLAAGLCLLMTGCVVVSKNDQNGKKSDNVSVTTPFGGVHVLSNQTTAADLGLPAYPGAALTTGSDGNDKSANVDLGFGSWQLHVKVVHYVTPDSRAKVVAFYRNALGQYGTVIACNGDTVVGTPAMTDQGLTCKEHDHDGNVNVNVQGAHLDQGFSLRAGSVHHQYIVAFNNSDNTSTKFTLVELVLPQHNGKNSTPD